MLRNLIHSCCWGWFVSMSWRRLWLFGSNIWNWRNFSNLSITSIAYSVASLGCFKFWSGGITGSVPRGKLGGFHWTVLKISSKLIVGGIGTKNGLRKSCYIIMWHRVKLLDRKVCRKLKIRSDWTSYPSKISVTQSPSTVMTLKKYKNNPISPWTQEIHQTHWTYE